MSKQQLQADMGDANEQEFEENLTKEEAQAVDAAWEETLNSPESDFFLDSLITQSLNEISQHNLLGNE